MHVMRGPVLLISIAALCLVRCGYVGDPLPPALNMPSPLTGFTAVQRGPDFVISFTAPATTTENLTLSKISGIDLRVSDKQIPNVAVPEPGEAVTLKVPAKEWSGQHVSVTLRLARPMGRYS